MRLPQPDVRNLLFVVLFVIALLQLNGTPNVLSPLFEEGTKQSDAPISQLEQPKITNTNSNKVVFADPIQAYADEVVQCPNNGVFLSKFFLCGTGDTRLISTGLTGSTVDWELLDESSCPPESIDDCPRTSSGCTWNNVFAGPDFTIATDGDYRVNITTSGVLERYYFRVSSNPLDPQVIHNDIICGNDGEIEVTNIPSGYEYSLNDPNGSYQTSPIFAISSPGNYMVYVRQQGAGAGACIFPSQEINVQQLDIDVQITPTDIICSGEFGSIEIQVNDVPGFYNYRLSTSGVIIDTFGPSNNSNYTFDNLNGGDYDILITTDDGCVYNGTTTISSLNALSVTAIATESFGCGNTSVDITATASGGTPPYQYSINGGSLGASNVLTVTVAGDQTVLVEDANGCQSTAIINIATIPEPEYIITANDSNCAGADDGSILISITDSKGYIISFSNDNGTTFQNGNNFSGLAPNTYNVIIRYESGTFICDIPISVTVNSLSAVTANAVVTQPYSCTSQGIIEIQNPSGGLGPYQYSIGGAFGNVSQFTGIIDGDYTPRVRDANGCIALLSLITIDPLNTPTDLTFDDATVDCVNPAANITVNVVGGTGPYDYRLVLPIGSAVNNGSNNVFTNLALGSYTFLVTDAEGCTIQESYAITDVSSIVLNGTLLNNVQCKNEANGAIRFSATGFATTYQYILNSGVPVTGQTAGSFDITGLSAGVYTLDITDDTTNCTDSVTITVEEPINALSLTADVTQMDCANNNRGSVLATATEGWGGYLYTLTRPDATTVGPQSGRNFNNLTQAGTYTLAVTDANGCTSTSDFTLTPVLSPVLAIDNFLSSFCYDPINEATISVSVTDGTAPFVYNINGGTDQASQTFSGLTPGNYTVNVIDANGCEDSLPVTIQPQINATAVITQELGCGGVNALIRVDISGGYTPYGNVEVSIGGSPFVLDGTASGSSYTYTATTDDTYQFTVTDSEGCSSISNIVIVNPRPTISLLPSIVTSTTCNENNGSIQIRPDTNIGTPPFTYDFGNTGTFTDQSLYTDLAPGTYDFTVRDANGCEATGSETITASTAITAASITSTDESCSGGNIAGTITITGVIGGTPPYTYTLYDADSSTPTGDVIGPASVDPVVFLNIGFGNYYVVVTDANGCDFVTLPVSVDSPLDVTITAAAVTPVDCAAGLSYDITINGGIGCFEIGIYNSGDPLVPPNAGQGSNIVAGCERNHQFSGLAFGTSYIVEVFDIGSGCTYIQEITPENPPTAFDVSATPTINASCSTSTEGEVTYTISNYIGATLDIVIINTDTGLTVIGPFTITPTSSPFTDTISGLGAGNYQIVVTDNAAAPNNCSDGATFTIDGPPQPLTIAPEFNLPANCNVGALVSVSASGGSGIGYEYAFMVSPNTPTDPDYGASNLGELDPAISLSWNVYVRDSGGCEEFINIVITEDAQASVPTATVINPCVAASGSFELDIISTIIGVPTPITYSIGGEFQTSNNFIGLNTGDYTISVRDGNGCVVSAPITIYDILNVSLSFSTFPGCNATDGIITAIPNGGSTNLTYELEDNLGNSLEGPISSPDFIGYGPGDYVVIVQDLDTGCSDSESLTLGIRTLPVLLPSIKTDISCNGENDGSIIAEIDATTADSPPYMYQLYDYSVPATPVPIGGPQTDPEFTGLGAGDYQVVVTSSTGCTGSDETITIIEPDTLLIDVTTSDFSCDPTNNSFNTATITVAALAGNLGTAPYTYSINGTDYQNSNTFEVVDDQTIQNFDVYIKDVNGCIDTQAVSFLPPNDLTITVSLQTAADCSTDTEVVLIEVSGGSGDFTFDLLPFGSEPSKTPAVGTNAASWDLTLPGDYIFAVTDNGAGGCAYVSPGYTVLPYDTIGANISNASPVTCFNGSNGSLQLNVTGYNGNYDYQVYRQDNTPIVGASGSANTSTTLTISNLPGGNVYVEVVATDAPLCDALSNIVNVPTPSEPIVLTLTEAANVTCSNDLGVIIAETTGGWGSYEYQVTNTTTGVVVQNYSSNNIFAGLSEGNHEVTVRDANGCDVSGFEQLDQPTPITGDIELLGTLICPGDNSASLQIDPTTLGGGEGSYLYKLNYLDAGVSSGLQTSPQFDNLPAGNYSVTVSDGWSCSHTSATINIPDPDGIKILLREVSPAGCLAGATLQLSVIENAIAPPYEYLREGDLSGVYTPMTQNGGTAENVVVPLSTTVETYRYFVREAGATACTPILSNQVTVDPAEPLEILLDLTNANIKCAGQSTGIIRATATGGVGSYQYELLDGNDVVIRPAQDSGIFRDLPDGNYYVRVDSQGCTDRTDIIPITDPVPLFAPEPTVVPISCFGGDDGSITLTASGGTGKVTFSISDEQDEFYESEVSNTNQITFSDLTAGIYDLIVQDELGCYQAFSVKVEEPLKLETSFNVTSESCLGDGDGVIEIQIAGGVAPYLTTMTPNDPSTFIQDQVRFENLQGDQAYIIYIKDAVGCTTTQRVELGVGVNFNPIVDVQYECREATLYNEVKISVGDIPPSDVLFSLDGGQYNTQTLFTDLTQGDHRVDVLHRSGCLKSVMFNVVTTEPLELSLADTDLNEITALAVNGRPPYQFFFNGEDMGTTNVFRVLENGIYEVLVIDANGCQTRAEIDYEFIDVYIPNFFTPNGDGQNETWYPQNQTSFPDIYSEIYDRYGRLVRILKFGEKWNGKYNSKALPSGDYWYVVRLKDRRDREFNGHFTLYR